MLIHVFNSSVVSGPETLAIPALKNLSESVEIVFLYETRLGDKSNGPIEYAKKLGYTVHRVDVRSRIDRRAVKELRALYQRLNPSLIHAHDVKASTYTAKAARGLSIPLVSTHHGVVARKGLIRLYEQYYVRWILPQFQAVLAVCQGDRQSLIDRGLPADRVFVHLNGVTRPFIDPQQRRARQLEVRSEWKASEPQLPDPEKAFYFGAVARLSSEKRHDRMVRMLAEVKRRRPDLPFALVCFGRGELESDIRALVKELEMEQQVFLMGYSNSIPDEMVGFDLLMSLSDGEGVPINLIEAGWAGTPVLSTSVGGIPDLVTGSDVGFLVEKTNSDETIADRVIDIMVQRAETRSVALNYQQHIVQNHSEQAWLDQLEQIYQKINSKSLERESGKVRAVQPQASV